MGNYFLIFNNFSDEHWNKDVGFCAKLPIINNPKNKSYVFLWNKNGRRVMVPAEFPHLILREFKINNRIMYYMFIILNVLALRPRLITLFHLSWQSVFLGVFFKFTFSKLYLKLDMNINFAIKLDGLLQRSRFKKILFTFLELIFNTVSAETSAVYKIISKYWSGGALRLIPNGILSESVCWDKNNYFNRENFILVVGRIGSPEKNHYLILEALEKISILNHSWHIYFLGPVSSQFEMAYREFIKSHPNFYNSIHLVGEVSRFDLFKFYFKSKIYLISSLYEGFSLAMLEAAYSGCFIVSTPVGGLDELNSSVNCVKKYVGSDELAKFFDHLFAGNFLTNHDMICEKIQQDFNFQKLYNEIYK